MQHIKENRTGFENKTYKFHQVKRNVDGERNLDYFLHYCFLLNRQWWIEYLLLPNYENFWFLIKDICTCSTSIGFCGLIISTFLCCYLTSYVGERSIVMACVTVPTILGAALFIGLPNSYKVGKLFGVYLLNFNSAIIAQV